MRKFNPLGPAPRPGQNQQGYLSIDLRNPPIVAGSVVVGNVHTHPSNPFTGPSGEPHLLTADYGCGMRDGVSGIVRGRGEQYGFIGPEHRSVSFHNAARFPQYPP